MKTLVIGALGRCLGAPAPLATLADELDSAQIDALAQDFDQLLVADGDIWQSAAAAAEETLLQSSSAPDLLVYVSQNDTDTTASLAQLTAALDLDDVPRLAVSGHECGNLGPALQLVSDAIAVGRATCVLLVLADHAAPGARMMRNGMSFFSDGAVAVLVASAAGKPPGFEVVCRVEDVAVVPIVGTPPEPPNLRATVTAVRAAVDRLATASSADSVALGHYRAPSRTFLHAATGLRSTTLLSAARQRSGHLFGADHLLALAELPAGGHPVVVVALGPWSSVALLVRGAAEGAQGR